MIASDASDQRSGCTKRTSPLSREQPNLADQRALNVRISLTQYSAQSYKTVTELTRQTFR